VSLAVAPAAHAAQGGYANKSVAEAMGDLADARLWILLGACALIGLVLWLGDVIRPGSLQRSGLRDVKPFPWILCLLAGAAIFLSLSLAVQFVLTQPWLVGAGADQVRELAVSQFLGYALGAMLGVCLLLLMVKSAPKAGLNAHSGDILVGLLCFALAFPFVELAGTLMINLYAGIRNVSPAEIEVAHSTLQLIIDHRDEPWTWMLIAAVVVGVPIVEEVVFRAFMQSGLLRLTGAPVWSILVTSLVFAGLHYSPEALNVKAQGSAAVVGAAVAGSDGGVGGGGAPIYALVPLFVLSVAIGLAYERTKKLGVAITMHAAFNALNVALALKAVGAL